MIKYLIAIVLICLPLNSAYGISKINGDNIVLLTTYEKEKYSDKKDFYENLTAERAALFCQNINKKLDYYTYYEIEAGHSSKYKNSTLPINGGFRPVSRDELEVRYHDGYAALAIVTLGLIPTIVEYKARIVKNINCIDKTNESNYILE